LIELKYFAIAESGDELEADDSRSGRSYNRKQLIDDDVRDSPPSGAVGRRMLPAPPKSVEVESGRRSAAIGARIMQRRRQDTTTSAGQCLNTPHVPGIE